MNFFVRLKCCMNCWRDKRIPSNVATANRSSKAFGYSLPELLRGYGCGRRWRRDLSEELRIKVGARPA
jgi:hypothetical protein